MNMFLRLKSWLKKTKNNIALTANYVRSNEQIFREIYYDKHWVSNEAKLQKFNSGSGSDYQYVAPYVQEIAKYVTKNKIHSIIDVGCGDFRVGQHLVKIQPNISYLGIEVFDEIIDHNRRKYGSNLIKFARCDFTEDQIPLEYFGYELCLVRQVMQHLSNRMIIKMLHNLKPFQHVIITEHQTNNPTLKNEDQVTSKINRTQRKSGIYLDEEPFNLKIKPILRIPVDKNSSINSYLLLKENNYEKNINSKL